MQEGLPFEADILRRDELLAVMSIGHPLTEYEKVPLDQMCRYPFMLLERSGKTEISEMFEGAGLRPDVKFTTWDDYAVMSMVESGLGIAILPKLILQRIPYRICTRSIDAPAYRDICFAVHDRKTAPLAVRRFEEYIRDVLPELP